MDPVKPGRHWRRRSYDLGDDLAIAFDLVLFAIGAFVVIASLVSGGFAP